MSDWRATLEQVQAAPVDTAALTGALRARWPAVRIGTVERIHGGLGAALHRLGLEGASVQTVVLRQLLPEFGEDAATLRREVTAQAWANRHGVPAPAVHWSDPTGAVLGRPAAVLEDVPGRLATLDLATASCQRALARVVATLASLPAPDDPALPKLGDVAAHADRFGPPHTASTLVDGTAIEAAIEELRGAFVQRGQLVHCDLHAGNVLWDGERVTGLLDWPGAAVGVAAGDHAYLWLDTALAHGAEVADALQVAIDGELPAGPPARQERRLWRAVALRRALPTPAPWAESYRAAGLDVTDAAVEQRFVALVTSFLEEG